MRGIASLSRIITRGQTSAEVVEHFQTHTQTLRVADVHANSKPLHASLIFLCFIASPALPRLTSPVVSLLDVLCLWFLGWSLVSF